MAWCYRYRMVRGVYVVGAVMTDHYSDLRMDIIGQNGNDGLHYEKPQHGKVNKYAKQLIGLDGTKTTIDVYRLLDAFGVQSHELGHAIKKLLMPGLRHDKSAEQDLLEAIQSIEAQLKKMEQIKCKK